MPRDLKAARFASKSSKLATKFASYRANMDTTRSALILGLRQIGRKKILAILNQPLFQKSLSALQSRGASKLR